MTARTIRVPRRHREPQAKRSSPSGDMDRFVAALLAMTAIGRLLLAAKLRRRLGRQIALAEADRRHQREMLGRADIGLELLVEGGEQILIFLAESEPAMTHHRIAGDFPAGR